MKRLITIIIVCFITLSYGQTNITPEEVKFQNLDITVTVDSAEEIKSTFNIKDLKSIFEETAKNEDVSFKIICNDKPMPNGKKSLISYKVAGNTSDIKGFLKRVKKIRKSAINYYNSK